MVSEKLKVGSFSMMIFRPGGLRFDDDTHPLLLTFTCRLDARLSRQCPPLRICGPQQGPNVSSTATVTPPAAPKVATSNRKSRSLQVGLD
jgi:hypothetical protein